MKTTYALCIILLIGILSACSTSYTPYAYDDTYYSPTNDPINKVKKDPREDFHKTDDITYDGSSENRYYDENSNSSPQDRYQNRYTQEEQQENNQQQDRNTNAITNNNNSNDNTDSEYYDEDYAQTLQQINSPVRSINTYDPYQRDRIIYTQNPYFTSPTLYGQYTFWDPFVPSTGLGVGWNSYSGWNIGVNAGFGYGYSGYGYGRPFCGSYYSPYYQPYYGYNPFSPWRYGYGNGYGYNNYWNGYNNGYNHGYNNGYYSGGSNNSLEPYSGRHRINTPRGGNGSPTYSTEGTSRPVRDGGRPSATPVNKNAATVNPSTHPTRTVEQGANTSHTKDEIQPQQSTRPTRTPARYQTPKSQETYTRPETPNRPTRTYNTPSAPKQSSSPSRPNNYPNYQENNSERRLQYTTPRTNNTYNRPNRVAPKQQARPQRTQPRQQPSTPPSMEYNRSKPTYNRSTPSYSPPTRSPGGGGSAPSRPTRSGGR